MNMKLKLLSVYEKQHREAMARDDWASYRNLIQLIAILKKRIEKEVIN